MYLHKNMVNKIMKHSVSLLFPEKKKKSIVLYVASITTIVVLLLEGAVSL